MSKKGLRVHATPLDNLVSNPRGEVGEVITSWRLMRDLQLIAGLCRRELGEEDYTDQEMNVCCTLADKLEDEVVARLSELSESKVGRLTFYFANEKLGGLDSEVAAFRRYMERNKFNRKRNHDISHKELPEKWADHRHIRVPYPVLLRGIAMAVRLMKRIDRRAVGPEAVFFWRKLRERRGKPDLPPRAQYMLAPYVKLSDEERLAVIAAEMEEGKRVWEPMETLIDGKPARVHACKKWGAVRFGGQVFFVPEYPLRRLDSINTGNPGSG